MSEGCNPDMASAWRITRCCAGPLGVVRLALWPAWLTAVPRRTARIGSPSRCASDRRLSTTTAAPSLQPVPSVLDENDLQRPSGDMPRRRLNSTCRSGDSISVTPAATARSHSPWRKALQARWVVTSDDEQAVSTVMLGPSRPSTYETRPDMVLPAEPVPT